MSSLRYIYKLLKNTEHHDNDKRYMATHDLITQLENVETLDENLQIRIRQAIIRQLDDKNTDVQTIAVRCLSTLVRKFDQEQVADIVNKLGGLISDGKHKENVDVYGIGLRTAITALEPEDGKRYAGALTKHLLVGLRQKVNEDETTHAVCLDILKELLARLGSSLVDEYQRIAESLLKLLDSSHASLRKRASFALGELARHLGEEPFRKLIAHITDRVGGSGVITQSNVAYLQTTSLICQSAGTRVGRYLSRILPALDRNFRMNGNSSSTEEANMRDDLWSSCLQAYESIVRECPTQAASHVRTMVPKMIQMLEFDPNYSYTGEKVDSTNSIERMEEDDAEDEDDGDGDWGEDEEFGDLSDVEGDNNDESWKVRRAAARAISAYVRAIPDSLLLSDSKEETKSGKSIEVSIEKMHLNQILTALISRVKERDLSVREEVLRALSHLLHEVSEIREPKTKVARSILLKKAKALVSSAKAEFRGESANGATRCAVMLAYQEMCMALAAEGEKMRDVLKDILPDIIEAIESKDTNLVEHALNSFRVILKQCASNILFGGNKQGIVRMHTSIKVIIRVIETSAPKICAKGLRVCQSMITSLVKQVSERNVTSDDEKKSREIIQNLFTVVYSRMSTEEVDLQVREAAITAMTILLAEIGTDGIKTNKSSAQDALKIIASRLNNEVTRMVSLQSMANLIVSPNIPAINLLKYLDSSTIKRYLAMRSPQLRSQTLLFLTSLCSRVREDMKIRSLSQQNEIAVKTLLSLVPDIALNISEADLYLARIALALLSDILTIIGPRGYSIPKVAATAVLKKVLKFARSPLNQGEVLKATIVLFKKLLESKILVSLAKAKKSSDGALDLLFEELMGVVDEQKLPESNFFPIAQCLSAAIITASRMESLDGNRKVSGEKDAAQIMKKLALNIKSKETGVLCKRVSLVALGECMREGVRLGFTTSDPISDLTSIVLSALEHQEEEVRVAAAESLGSIFARPGGSGLATILKIIQQRPRQKYLLLSSLKKALMCILQEENEVFPENAKATDLHKILVSNADAKEEGIRSLVAECYGALFAGAANQLSALVPKLAKGNSCLKVMILSALRHALVSIGESLGRKQNASSIIQHPCISVLQELFKDETSELLELFDDTDLNVRVQAMSFIYSAIPLYPSLFKSPSARKSVLASIYKATTRDQKLVKTVNMGPFEHKVDAGLPLRRFGFRALGVVIILDAQLVKDKSKLMLSSASDRLESLKRLLGGLTDDESDIVLLGWRILQDISSSSAASALLEIVNILPSCIMQTIKKYLRAAKGNDSHAERARHVLRECVRGLYAMTRIPGSERCTDFKQFFQRVKQTSMLKQMLVDCMKEDHMRKN